jgi:hypothetical protein
MPLDLEAGAQLWWMRAFSALILPLFHHLQTSRSLHFDVLDVELRLQVAWLASLLQRSLNHFLSNDDNESKVMKRFEQSNSNTTLNNSA